ncbi:MAG: SDR family NAD(P)-dependent oxidoreductase, partial [Gammaproteobacteria bacterium]|nr:SDR family NAD(P)-dependent oxidoreductase [Gemmatimonadota bacterium]NIR37180.1 SDR family NAD(P)-dependent oxidoreductase [Actinomycetota bacterium]NIU75059.1 SDR family NAD(P)-dependent oxidoreductase [Gammaproteobacteria bacterium]NIY09144.1 SDR family NAD(P)-dependent oxidoreductase [Gemmatimonadota bacterium]
AAFRDFCPATPLDVLVNNAAETRDHPFITLAPHEWEPVIATNLTGTYHCCRAAAAGMMARRRGVIINIASVAGMRASPAQANYAASK